MHHACLEEAVLIECELGVFLVQISLHHLADVHVWCSAVSHIMTLRYPSSDLTFQVMPTYTTT